MSKDLTAFLEVKDAKNNPFTRDFKSALFTLRGGVISSCKEQIHEPENYIPIFQRDNDKWTKSMQKKFIENIVVGCSTSISLYTVSKNEFPKWLILDGLQRLTAISLFIQDELKIFNGLVYSDIKNQVSDGGVLEFKRYRFNSEIEAVEFYIAINENITHSKKDIQRAKDYLAKLKNTQTKEDICH